MVKTIVRIALAVAAGAVVWGVSWNLGTHGLQRIFPELLRPGLPVSHAGVLWGLIAYSVALSAVAGCVTALVATPERRRTAVALLAAIQLALGIAAELSYWELMPTWYHLVFLALVAPVTLWGGSILGSSMPIRPTSVGTRSGWAAPAEESRP